ncbi:MAG: EAL domain-containing protein [Mycobacteriales bacterium]
MHLHGTAAWVDDAQLVGAAFAVKLAGQQAAAWRDERRGPAAAPIVGAAAAMAAVLLSNVGELAVLPGSHTAFWLYLRSLALDGVVLSILPLGARLTGRRPPRWLVAGIVSLVAVRVVLWPTTELFAADRLSHGYPVYGPLSTPTAVVLLALLFGYSLQLAREAQPDQERRMLATALLLSLLLAAISVAVTAPLAAELLTGYTTLPCLAGVAGVLRLREEHAEQLRVAQPHERAASDFAYLICEVDDLDAISAAYGPDRAERLVREVELRLSDAVRTGDVVTRRDVGPFVVLASGVDSRRAVHVARSLVEAVEGVIDLDGIPMWASVTIGAAASSDVAVDLVPGAAMTALRDAKRRGRGTAVVFDATASDRRVARRVASDPRRAAASGIIGLHYRPIVQLATQEVVGAEAVIWCVSPADGAVSRRQLVAAARADGFATELGSWALRQACLDAAQWPGNWFVAVDLAPMQFTEGLLEVVGNALDESGLPAERLWLEVSETVTSAEASRVRDLLRRLVELGVHVSLDNFGAGDHAMGYLRELPLGAVKIERGFVHFLDAMPDDAATATAMIKLAGSLRVPMIADGVETYEQVRTLHALGCRYGEGPMWGPDRAANSFASSVAEIGREGPPLLPAQPEPRTEVDVPAVAVMRKILTMHALGASPASIAATLNQEGVAPQVGDRWRQVTVATLIATWL